MRRLFLFSLLWSLTAIPVTFGEQNIFIGIGIDTYDNKEIASTPYCVNDVKLISEKLRHKERGLFSASILLHSQQTNKRYLPTKNNILGQLEARIPFLTKKDTIVVYFAGHGYINANGQGFLIPQDADPTNLEKTAIPTSAIRGLLGETQAKAVVLVLDCCHAGAARGVKVNVKLKATGFELGKEFSKLKNVLTIASCRANQKSYTLDKQKHGLFTYVFSQALHNDDLDGNGDGYIEAAELYVYVRDTVNKAAKTINKTQTPGEIVFGQRPDVRLCKAIGGTRPFESNFAMEQSGLPPKGWTGQLVVKNGVLVPTTNKPVVHSVQLPPQRIRDGFFLSVTVNSRSINQGGVVISVPFKGKVPWIVGVSGHKVIVGGQKVQVKNARNGKGTETITLKRVMTPRGTSLSVYLNNTMLWTGVGSAEPCSKVFLGLKYHKRGMPSIHSVKIGPIRTK